MANYSGDSVPIFTQAEIVIIPSLKSGLKQREYGFIKEAHAQLSVVGNCSSVRSGGGTTADGQGVVSSSRGRGEDRQ
jgi:hypothetical protein